MDLSEHTDVNFNNIINTFKQCWKTEGHLKHTDFADIFQFILKTKRLEDNLISACDSTNIYLAKSIEKSFVTYFVFNCEWKIVIRNIRYRQWCSMSLSNSTKIILLHLLNTIYKLVTKTLIYVHSTWRYSKRTSSGWHRVTLPYI